MRLVMDLETNGLLDRADLKVLCGCVFDVDTGTEWRFRPHGEAGVDSLEDMLDLLYSADRLIGHNICGFDLPVLERIFGYDDAHQELYDTLLASRLAFVSNIWEKSWKFRNSGARSEEAREAKMPKRLLSGRTLHSLETWGYRLQHEHKGDFLKEHGVQEEWSQGLEDYCMIDVRLNARLYKYLLSTPAGRGWEVCSEKSMLTESRFGRLMYYQEDNGVRFNVSGAEALCQELQGERAEVVARLREAVPPWYAPKSGQKDHCPRVAEAWDHHEEPAGYSVPKRTFSKGRNAGQAKGAALTKLEIVEFNPGSTAHIANRLTAMYGWKPTAFTPKSGEPKVDDDILAGLEYPIVSDLRRYLLLNKRLGQIAEGKQAWLKKVGPDGIIHGRIHPTGTRTSRCSHFGPNLGQAPGVKSPYGPECRALFSPTREGWLQVGIDASGIELRMLAHRLAYYDGGAFAQELLQGDAHEMMRKATGLFYRENQKTLTYADLYGAGDEKRGLIVIADWREAFENGLTDRKPPSLRVAWDLGKRVKAQLTSVIPALAHLQDATKQAHARGWIRALDGRVLACPTEHGALNDVLQSDGAIVMKYAILRFDHQMRRAGYERGVDYAPLLHVHDEYQFEAPTRAMAHLVGAHMVEAIEWAGEHLGVRCPLTGEVEIGSNWAETH